MMRTTIIDENTKPTEAQLERIREGAKYPIEFDEDCPELPPEKLKQFRRVQTSATA